MPGLAVLLAVLKCPQRASGCVLLREDDCCIGINDVGLGTSQVVRSCHLPQLVLGWDGAIQCLTALWAPAAMREVTVYGSIKTAAVCAGLAS